jgi:glycosyltransferase involved in cell wall biosynthesis
LVIPAYNEAERIGRCLDAVLATPIRSTCEWSEWVILDDSSTDGTAETVMQWAHDHPGVPLRIDTGAVRSGKAAALGAYHSSVVELGCTDDLVVVIDADCAVTDGAVDALLATLEANEDLVVVWGRDRPDKTGPRRWASAFQMEVLYALTRRVGSDVPRAYGRLFAYRVGPMSDFGWEADEITDDIQLARFLHQRGLSCQTVDEALILATPAGTLRDFYLQTYKALVASAVGQIPGASRRQQLMAALETAARRPHWAVTYGLARSLAALLHRIRPTHFTALWIPPRSTKQHV